MTEKALILVDFENEWLDKKSDYYISHDISDVLENTNKLIDFCRSQNYKIIFIRHIEKESDTVFVENSHNTEIIENLHKRDNDIVVKKYKISPFFKTNFEEELVGINEIIVSWILSNLCVRSLIHDAYDRDFKITVVTDCCTAFDKKTQDFTFQDLKRTREEINFTDINTFISSL